MTEYKTGRTPHPKDAVSADMEGGLSQSAIVTQRIRKLERVTGELAKDLEKTGEEIGLTDDTPEKVENVRASYWLGDATIRWNYAKNSRTFEVRHSDWADVEGAAATGTTNASHPRPFS